MRSRGRFILICVVGTSVFLALVWLTFDVQFSRALAGAIGTMVPVAVLGCFLPQQKLYQLFAVAIVAGIIIGVGLWWVLPYEIPWYYYAIPCVVIAIIEALLERWADRFKKTPG